MSMRPLIAVTLAIGLGLTSAPALGSVNLELRPVEQTVMVDSMVEIGLYAVSDDQTDQIVRGLQAVLMWDPSHLELLTPVDNGPYTWFLSGFFDDSGADGLNADCGPDVFCEPYTGLPYNDGNAYFQNGADFSVPAMATPAGLLVTTFQFTALIDQPSTEVWISPGVGGTGTQVFGDVPGQDVAGTLGGSTITIMPAQWGALATDSPDAVCGVVPGQTVKMLLAVSELENPVNGVQAVIDFDQDALSFVSITPGDGAGSPWDSAAETAESVADGRLTYALIILAGETAEDSIVATAEFVFQPVGQPAVADVKLLAEADSWITRLTQASHGAAVIPDLGASLLFALPGDADADGDIDLADHAGLVSCLTGPNATYPAEACCRFDLDTDGDVDLVDFAEFERLFTGS